MKTIFTITALICWSLSYAQKPVLMVPSSHSSGIRSFACSGDGDTFITLGGDENVKIWNTAGKELVTHKFTGTTPNIVELNSDGSRFLIFNSYAPAQGVKVCDSKTGQTLYTINDVPEGFKAAVFSAVGDRMATCSVNGEVQLRNEHTGEIISRFPVPIGVRYSHIGFSANGKVLAFCGDISEEQADLLVWDVEKGTQLNNLNLSTGYVRSMDISPDGAYVLIGENMETGIKIWNMQTQKEAYVNREYFAGYFLKDEQQITVLHQHNYSEIINWQEPSNHQPLRMYPKLVLYDGPPMIGVVFARVVPDGKRLMLRGMGDVEVHDVETGELLFTLGGDAVNVADARFSPDGKKILLATGATLRELDFDDQIQWRQYSDGHIWTIKKIRYAAEGQYIISQGDDFNTVSRMAGSGTIMYKRPSKIMLYPTPGYAGCMAVSEDGRFVAKIHREPEYGSRPEDTIPVMSTYSVSDGRTVGDFTAKTDEISSIEQIEWAPDGKKLGALMRSEHEKLLQIWDVLTAQALPPVHFGAGNVITAFQFAPESKQVLCGRNDGKLLVWDLNANKPVRTVAAHSTWVNDLTLNADYTLMATASNDKTIRLWRYPTLEPAGILEGHNDAVDRISFSRDGRFLLSVSRDKTVKIWDVLNKTLLGTMVLFETEDWAITTPNGLFDASPGAMKRLYFLVGDEPLELEQLKWRYYEPGLVQKLLAVSDEPLRSVDQFADLPLYPRMRGSIRQDTLDITLTPRNGGVGKLSLFMNGKEVCEDINPGRANTLKISLTEYWRHFNPDGQNKIWLRVYNEAGWLKSPAYKFRYNTVSSRGSGSGSGDGPKPLTAKPSFYAVLVGTSDYAGTELDLRYPDLDAAAMSQAVQSAGKVLFSDRVNVKTLQSVAAKPEAVSTKDNIRNAFLDLADTTKSNDVVLIYFSGHGVTYGSAETAQFYYLTKDLRSQDLSDPEIRNKYAISSNELSLWLAKIAAQKRVLILDACNSGKLVEDMAAIGKKELIPSQIRALDRMKDRTGTFILTGSAANKVSYEASQYGQGLLTYSLLQGMSGLGLTDDKRVDVMTLFQFSRDKVPELAKGINGIQTPVLAFPLEGSSFDIGIVNDQVKIPLAQGKPVFIRNNFQDQDAFDDVLGLTDALSNYLEGVTAKGSQAELVYVDVNKYENAYSIKGRYHIEGENVRVTGKLYKGKNALGDFDVDGKTADVKGLAETIIDMVLPLAN